MLTSEGHSSSLFHNSFTRHVIFCERFYICIPQKKNGYNTAEYMSYVTENIMGRKMFLALCRHPPTWRKEIVPFTTYSFSYLTVGKNNMKTHLVISSHGV